MSSAQGNERDIVPDACETLTPGIAAKLVPGADRSSMADDGQADQHSECAWSAFGENHRQLTIEIRALTRQGATSATDVAVRTLKSEMQSDRAGKNLADTAQVRAGRNVSGVGEQAYVVYTVDGGQEVGEAIANARLANILVTVHFSGGQDEPISYAVARDGALSAARDIIAKVESHS